MPKRKVWDNDGDSRDGNEREGIPLPIQTFLWRQTSPFLRPQGHKGFEITCLEVKEACKSFEKVLVQNILFGLSPSLTDAIASISRWGFVQASFPHVLHCCAAILSTRKETILKLGSGEMKLLYTIHWILLDAAEECAEASHNHGHANKPFHYFFPVTVIEIFVYLFAPLCFRFKESDFLNFRMENGLRIWQAMWDFRSPDVPCFTAPVRPKRSILSGMRHKSHGVVKCHVQKTKFGDVFLGTKPSFEETSTTSSPGGDVSNESGAKIISSGVLYEKTPQQEECEEFPAASSFNEELLPTTVTFTFDYPLDSHGTDQVSVTRVEDAPTTSTARAPSKSGEGMKTSGSTLSYGERWKQAGAAVSRSMLGRSGLADGANNRRRITSANRGVSVADTSMATFMDVAVLRCLFIPQWLEEGVFWALQYIFRRLDDIYNNGSPDETPRKRSSSLPIPKIEVSLYRYAPGYVASSSGKQQPPAEPETSSFVTDSPFLQRARQSERFRQHRFSSERVRPKKMKISDLKAFVDSKLRSRSDKQLESIGSRPDVTTAGFTAQDETANVDHMSIDDSEVAIVNSTVLGIREQMYKEPLPPRPQSALAKLIAQKSEPENGIGDITSELVRGKSMPSLSYIEDDEKPVGEYVSVGVQRISRSVRVKGSKTAHRKKTSNNTIKNPIITVTEHTPSPSPDHDSKIQNEIQENRQSGGDEGLEMIDIPPTSVPWLPRSHTDSDISYRSDDVTEASGSICYITKDGQLDYLVILKAVHSVTLRDNVCSVRVCESTVNVLDLLMEFAFPKEEEESGEYNGDSSAATTTPNPKITSSAGNIKTSDGQNVENLSTHHLFMDSLARVYTHLGCPHGCGDGHRGPPAEFLRSQSHNTLGKLHKVDKKQFRKYLQDFVKQRPLTEVLDFFHAFVGFCVDPSSSISPLGHKRNKAFETSFGYTTNFGAATNETDYRGVERLVFTYVFKPLVTRLVDSARELSSPDNMSLYCDVRQLMTYVKEAHGGIFRRIALSGLLDSTERPNKKKYVPTTVVTTRVFKHSQSLDQDDARDSPHSPTVFTIGSDDHSVEKHQGKKTLFRKKSMAVRKISSSQSIIDENEDLCPSPVQGQSPIGMAYRQVYMSLTPRLSISEEEACASTSGSPTFPRRKGAKLSFVNWIKGDRKNDSGNDDDFSEYAADITNGLAGMDRTARRCSQLPRAIKGVRTSIGSSSSAPSVSTTLVKAKKRVEDHLYKFGFGRTKNKHGSIEEPQEFSRRNSPEIEKGPGEPESIILKERRLVDVVSIQRGMQRFAFLLETCQPGSVPDPPLLAAMLDLKAPIVARAALLSECCFFVHRCNKGQWPTWMKLNLPMFRPSGPLANRGTPSGLRRTHILQKAAGKMFYQWAEAIGKRMEEIIIEEDVQISDIVSATFDENKKRQLKREDEEEDFLDEGSVNSTGSGCPVALKLIACQLLLEITAFLRETYQYLPKSTKTSHRERCERSPWERLPNPNRRWSVGLGVMGFSQTSAPSLVSIADFGHPGAGYQPERKISFVIQDSGEPESGNSSNTTLTMPGEESLAADDKKGKAEGDAKGRKIAHGRAHLLRRGGPQSAPSNASFKRRSFRLKKTSARKDREDVSDDGTGCKRSDSIKSKRKVSAISDRSDTSEHAEHDISGEDSPGILSDEQVPDSPIDGNEADDSTVITTMPWIKVVVQLANSFNFICSHHNYCHPNCYRRQMRATYRLMRAVRKTFGEEFQPDFSEKQEDQTGIGSPVKRKESFGRNMDKISAETSGSTGSMLGAMRSRPGSMTHLARDIIEASHVVVKSHTVDLKPDKKSPNDNTPKEPSPILRYLQTQVQNLFHCPLAILIKSCVIASDDVFTDIIPVAWELLLENDQQVAASAAVAFILSAIKVPDLASDLLCRELRHEDVNQRINAILRFKALWRFRFQTWPRMEEGAQQIFKIPPPGIDFTLPSPKIGVETTPVVDPPWMPHYKTKVEEVTINQDKTVGRSFVTATKTRKKQQMEMVQSALRSEDEKKRVARENFLLTTVPVTMQAAYEPALYHAAAEDHDDLDEDHSDPNQRPVVHHVQVAASVFPSCLCAAAIPLINLLDDATVSSSGLAVYVVAHQAVWTFLVEDPALFLRYFLEKITRERQDEMLQLIRRLLRFIPELPPQAGFTLFNYMVGYIMFYVRTPVEGGQETIGNAMSLLWMIVSNIQGVFLKDLKQILRKEQCDTTLLITANVPCAKKVVVHGPDAAGIPSQFPISEDTQFLTILQDSIDFFGIDESQKKEWHLFDLKTNQMHNLNAYVRDFYYFKRSQYPQLNLVRMSPDNAYKCLQKQAFALKFVEIGKVMLTLSILKTSNQIAARVFFLHEELQKLPSFPRKALEADLGLFSGPLGKELLGLDVLHKYSWVKLVARMFEAMAGTFAYASDIHLFLTVINGALVLFCEDSAILRQCMATLINASLYFKNVFATNGYFLIMPTLLRIYATHQTNLLLCRTIEFVCKQFYIVHQNPFILQMFGSVAPILDIDVSCGYGELNKVDPYCLFRLLLGLEQTVSDPLEIMDIVQVDKPLRALDFCYQNDPESFTVLDGISLCVTVVAYSADSTRGHQMLTILEAILPHFLKHLQDLSRKLDPPSAARLEIQAMHQLATYMKALLNNCEALTKNYTGPQTTGNPRSSSIRNVTKSSYSPAFDFEEDSHSRFLNDLNSRKYQTEREMEDSQVMQTEFRKPRSVLLNVVAEFITKCYGRYHELSKKTGQEAKTSDLLDTKCHMKLADVAHSLLKVSPYDPLTMACKGLQRYMNEILPITDWSQESLRPALMTIARRLDKTFNKIAKKPVIRRNTDWDAAANLLKGIYLTLSKHPYVAHLPHLKSLISVCQGIIIGDPGANVPLATEAAPSMSSSAILNQIPPHHFCSVVIKLIAIQMLVLKDSLSLEQISGGVAILSTPEKTEAVLINLIIPLCIRVGSGRKDVLTISRSDIAFSLNVIVNALNPPTHKAAANIASFGNKSDTRSSMSVTDRAQGRKRQVLLQIAFLGLKTLMVCFESQLNFEWHRLARCVRQLHPHSQGGLVLWGFLDFVVSYKTPLYVLLMPFIHQKLAENEQLYDEEYQIRQSIKDKISGYGFTKSLKCKAVLLLEFANELRKIQQDITNKKTGDIDPRKSVVTDATADTDGHRKPILQAVPEARHAPTDQNVSEIKKSVSVSSGSISSAKDASLARGWSIRSEKLIAAQSQAVAVTIPDLNHRQVGRLLRRTSYPEGDNLNGQDVLKTQSPTATSEPRLTRFTRRSTRNIRKPSARATATAGDGAAVDTSSIPSITNMMATSSSADMIESPTSPSKESIGGGDGRKHRLHRKPVQSRKTFRFRSMKKVPQMGGVSPDSQDPKEKEETALNYEQTTDKAVTVPRLTMTLSDTEQKVDSMTSPPSRTTSSKDALLTCENLSDSADSLSQGEQTALLQEAEPKKTFSQQSLLLVFDPKDENTLL
ncbi:hypothetical protein CHUAL_010920 [Chamberlinius hualienensis]